MAYSQNLIFFFPYDDGFNMFWVKIILIFSKNGIKSNILEFKKEDGKPWFFEAQQKGHVLVMFVV